MYKTSQESTRNKHIKKKDIKINILALIVSDSLSAADNNKRKKLDESGRIVKEFSERHDYNFLGIEYLPDEMNLISNFILQKVKGIANVIITIGGTGIAERDITIETVTPLYSKELVGFGELFRHLTYEQLGTVSIMTRATAGIINKKLVVSLPGSPNAVKLGIDIVSKELIHILNHV